MAVNVGVGGGINSVVNAPSTYSPVQWILAIFLFYMFLYLFTRIKIGYVIVYYLLVLAILFLVAYNYKWFVNLLAPLTTLSGV